MRFKQTKKKERNVKIWKEFAESLYMVTICEIVELNSVIFKHFIVANYCQKEEMKNKLIVKFQKKKNMQNIDAKVSGKQKIEMRDKKTLRR